MYYFIRTIKNRKVKRWWDYNNVKPGIQSQATRLAANSQHAAFKRVGSLCEWHYHLRQSISHLTSSHGGQTVCERTAISASIWNRSGGKFCRGRKTMGIDRLAKLVEFSLSGILRDKELRNKNYGKKNLPNYHCRRRLFVKFTNSEINRQNREEKPVRGVENTCANFYFFHKRIEAREKKSCCLCK